MSELFKSFVDGDRRTVVKTFKRGDRLYFVGKKMVVVQADCKIKVTEQWNYVQDRWDPVSYDLEGAVSLFAPSPKEPLPEAKTVKRPWYRFLF